MKSEKKVKTLLPLLMCTLAVGCSSSSDSLEDANNVLIGVWLSNCHEFFGTEDEMGNNLYNVSEITITEKEFVDNYTSYTDINCTENPVAESGSSRYVVGEMVATTDGVAATRLTLIPILPERPELEILYELVYRVSGVELNFGQYVESEVQSIDTSVTYIKQ